MPLSIVIESARVTLPQLSVVELPAVIVLGDVVNDETEGGPRQVFTITVTCFDVVPPQPVAVNRYVVVLPGLMVRLP
ncbi:MAG: hypothetical protein KGJ80_18380, partial [Chloroflexota bacterium]|nr:hypothetical protein [Chloroflexota bacterium]